MDAIRRIESLGAEVEVRSLDITDHTAVAAMMDDIGRGPRPLRGILHAAGVNWFSKVVDMDRARTLETLKIKISAAWNLHELTREAELDFFILYSSVSALWGSVSFSHYTAANSFMDALAWYRRQHGLPALSINWGPWSEAGMSAGYEETRILSKLGFQLMTPERALRALERALVAGQTQLVIADINWKIFQSVVNFSFSPVFFSRVSSASSESVHFKGDRAEAVHLLELPQEEARDNSSPL